jgi:hypothetical protein
MTKPSSPLCVFAFACSTSIEPTHEADLEAGEAELDEAAKQAPQTFPGPTEPIANCDPASGHFTANVTNPYFPMPVCSRKILEHTDDEGVTTRLQITILPETGVVAGVTTRILEELETEDGELVEISRNHFVQAVGGGVPADGTVPRHGTVCYFGESVDIFEEDGTVTHEGEWFAGVDGALPGIIMPSIPRKGQAYLQEVAPGVAEDRAWHTKLQDKRLFVSEDTPLEPGQISRKVYKRGIGLVRDADLTLVSFEMLDDDECKRRCGEGDDGD